MTAFGEWDVVQRKTHSRWLNLILGVFNGMVGAAPDSASEVTWTLQHRKTGEVRTVRATSERHAAEKVASWSSESAPARS